MAYPNYNSRGQQHQYTDDQIPYFPPPPTDEYSYPPQPASSHQTRDAPPQFTTPQYGAKQAPRADSVASSIPDNAQLILYKPSDNTLILPPPPPSYPPPPTAHVQTYTHPPPRRGRSISSSPSTSEDELERRRQRRHKHRAHAQDPRNKPEGSDIHFTPEEKGKLSSALGGASGALVGAKVGGGALGALGGMVVGALGAGKISDTREKKKTQTRRRSYSDEE